MKKQLIACLIFIISCTLKAQVVFCPPGAIWSYAQKYGLVPPPKGGKIFNLKVKYSGKTVVDGDTCKILTHRSFFTDPCSLTAPSTLIKQKGDTIFFRNNNTMQAWQVLFNFNCQPGQSWQAKVYETATSFTIYTTTVVSTTVVTINGHNLKQLTVTKNPGGITSTITERIGYPGYLFGYTSSATAWCDMDYLHGELCYQDDSFGVLQYTTMACDYSDNLVGLDEKINESEWNVYPNPAENVLNLTGTKTIVGIKILNGVGQVVGNDNSTFEDKQVTINTQELPAGIYTLLFTTKDKTTGSKRFVVAR